MKYIILSISFIFLFTVAKAQVGIGTQTPNDSSVLDLSNGENKGLLLPWTQDATPSDAMSTKPGMVYFHKGDVYYRRADGYNALSPWKYKFDGNGTNNVFYNLGGGIGIIGINSTTVAPEAPLHIDTSQAVSLTANGSFLIGNSLSENLVFNTNEIQARNAGSEDTLTINEDGGLLQVGSQATPVDVNTSGTVKQLHKPTNSYHDLLPQGAIIMWSGSTIPGGWAFCDGESYPASNGSGNVLTPNLIDRFIVGRTSPTTLGAAGGTNARSLPITESQMPSHYHSAGNLTAAENSAVDGRWVATDRTGFVRHGVTKYTPPNNWTVARESFGNPLSNHDTKHTHSVSGSTGSKGLGQPFTFNVKPKYFALAYIMKL